MANEPYTITNQKLYFAKSALANWQAAEKSAELNKALLKAQQEVVIFHLYSVLWAVYNEIASFYRFPLLNDTTPLNLFLTKQFIEQHPSPELNELFSLLATPSSTIALINKAWLELFNMAPVVTQATQSIALKDLDEPLSSNALHANLQELTALVSRFRISLTEF